jgi:hypothetical protein
MSKKRELLKRVRDTLHELKETHYDLYWDIQAELDLAEQVPVAWMSTKREPLSDERLEFLVDKYHGYPKTLGREIEKAHGIGVENE